jgi:hypothetical protein
MKIVNSYCLKKGVAKDAVRFRGSVQIGYAPSVFHKGELK